MYKIIITSGTVSVTALLNDSPTAEAIYNLLPLDRAVNRWGEEIHFAVPVFLEPEPDSREFAEVGELGYWPVGDSFCIFCGKTPASIDSRPKACGPVNIFGKITGDIEKLRAIPEGSSIHIEQAEETLN